MIFLAENKTQSIFVQDKAGMCELLVDYVETNVHDYARPSSMQVEHPPPPPPAVQPATTTPGALSTIT